LRRVALITACSLLALICRGRPARGLVRRDHILFYDYFHGDNGAGLGASHRTEWTGLVVELIQLFGLLDPKKLLEDGRTAAFTQGQEQR
jgi:hypothetical protein